MARIVVTQGAYKGQDIELKGDQIVIGRDKDCDLALHDTEVSRRHAKLYRDNGEWHLADLDSANGTTLNEQTVRVAALNTDDVIAIGGTTFIFKNGDAPAASPAPVATDGRAASTPEPKAASTPASASTSGMMATADDLKLVEQMRQSMDAIRKEVGKVIVGQEEVLNEILMCIIAGGHALLIGLPGLAKTLTVNTIDKVLDM